MSKSPLRDGKEKELIAHDGEEVLLHNRKCVKCEGPLFESVEQIRKWSAFIKTVKGKLPNKCRYCRRKV